MMITKLARTLITLFLLMALGHVLAQTVSAAPRFSLDVNGQANISLQNGQTATVTVTIDAETNTVTGGDSILMYPAGDIDIISVANGGYFTDFAYNNNASSGRLEMHGYFSSLYATKTGSGNYANVTIRAKKGTGGGTITFNCNGSDSSSRITKSDFTNILNCQAVNQLAMSFTGGSQSTTPTPTPTGASANTPTPTHTTAPGQPTNTPTATPTQATAAGQNPTCNFLAVDTNYGAAPLTVSLICAGSDPEDDIWAAEYDFGDGKKQEFTKNVGKSGSFTVAYVYGKAGTYYPTCRVRDISNHYSDRRSECRRTVTVTGISDSGSNNSIKPTSTPTKKPTSAPASSVKPSPQVAELVDFLNVSPTPVISQPEISKDTKKFDLPRLFLGISIIVGSLAIGGYLIYKNKGNDNLPPPSIPIVQE